MFFWKMWFWAPQFRTEFLTVQKCVFPRIKDVCIFHPFFNLSILQVIRSFLDVMWHLIQLRLLNWSTCSSKTFSPLWLVKWYLNHNIFQVSIFPFLFYSRLIIKILSLDLKIEYIITTFSIIELCTLGNW